MTHAQFDEITEWQAKTFPNATPLSKISHLAKELQELVVDIQAGNPDRDMEYADCFFLLFGAAAADGMSYHHICNAIEKKFQINRKRAWGKPDADGVVEHVRE